MNFPRSWQWLPSELASHVAQFLLDDDVVDYLSFRAVCREWRSSTASPRGLDSCFRPRRWIMLCDGDANLYTGTQRRFLNLSTCRSLLLHLPELESNYVISDSDGLLVLVDKVTYLVRLFNPFTRHLADLPRLPKDIDHEGTDDEANDEAEIMDFGFGAPDGMGSFSSSISSGSCPTVVFLSNFIQVVYFAKPGDSSWKVLDFPEFPNSCPDSMLCFKGRLYSADPVNGIQSVELEKNLFTPSILPIPHHNGCLDHYYLAEYNAEMLMVYHKASNYDTVLPLMDQTFSIFKVDLESNRLVPLNVGHLSLFLGFCGRSLVISSKSLPSIKGNSVYCSAASLKNPIMVYDFDGGEPDLVSMDSTLHDYCKRVRSSIRPFTLAHHLSTYCEPLHWSIGLMYHEFMSFPDGWLSNDCQMVDLKRNYSLSLQLYD